MAIGYGSSLYGRGLYGRSIGQVGTVVSSAVLADAIKCSLQRSGARTTDASIADRIAASVHVVGKATRNVAETAVISGMYRAFGTMVPQAYALVSDIACERIALGAVGAESIIESSSSAVYLRAMGTVISNAILSDVIPGRQLWQDETTGPSLWTDSNGKPH